MSRRTQKYLPATILVGACLGFCAPTRIDGNRFIDFGPSPDGVPSLLLQNHVVTEETRNSNLHAVRFQSLKEQLG